MAYKIRLIDKDKEMDAFIELFEVVFGKEMTTKLWEWKYLENPMIIDQPLIYIAEHEGKMVGARPLLPNRMRFGDKTLKVAQPCDTMVHPDHRRKGLFTKMTQFAIDDSRENGFSLFYNFPNQKSYPGYIKLGWKKILEREASYNVFSPKRVISLKISNLVLSSIANVAFKSFFNKSKISSLKPESSCDINEERYVTKEFEELWRRCSDNWKIGIVRDKEYLEWRFVKHPENDYCFFTAHKNRELLGYIVTNIVKNRDLVEGRIVDYVIKDNLKEVFLSLLLEALEKFKKEGCDLVSTWAFTQPELQQVLDRCGFVKKSSFPYNIFTDTSFFVVRKIVSNCLPVNPLKKENWYITQSDQDTH